MDEAPRSELGSDDGQVLRDAGFDYSEAFDLLASSCLRSSQVKYYGYLYE